MSEKKPIQGAKVEIYKDEKLIDHCYTNEYGICEFYLPEDTYKIKVTKEGYEPHEQTINLIEDYVKEVLLSKVGALKEAELLSETILSDVVSAKEYIPKQAELVSETILSDILNIRYIPAGKYILVVTQTLVKFTPPSYNKILMVVS